MKKEYGKTNNLWQAFDQGMFSGHEVNPFPAQMVDLYERMTGKKFNAVDFQMYERIRAFLDYTGIYLTDAHRVEQMIPALKREEETKLQEVSHGVVREPTTQPTYPAGFSPADLGED